MSSRRLVANPFLVCLLASSNTQNKGNTLSFVVPLSVDPLVPSSTAAADALDPERLMPELSSRDPWPPALNVPLGASKQHSPPSMITDNNATTTTTTTAMMPERPLSSTTRDSGGGGGVDSNDNNGQARPRLSIILLRQREHERPSDQQVDPRHSSDQDASLPNGWPLESGPSKHHHHRGPLTGSFLDSLKNSNVIPLRTKPLALFSQSQPISSSRPSSSSAPAPPPPSSTSNPVPHRSHSHSTSLFSHHASSSFNSAAERSKRNTPKLDQMVTDMFHLATGCTNFKFNGYVRVDEEPAHRRALVQASSQSSLAVVPGGGTALEAVSQTSVRLQPLHDADDPRGRANI